MDKYLNANRRMWDERVRVHQNDSECYPVSAFKAGDEKAVPPLPDDIGPVNGKSILHLQCHFGMDSLGWTRKGAKVTGVDFSPVAIAQARQLNDELGLDARFIETDIADLPAHLTGQFDIVMTYYGTIIWLPDLRRWAKVIAHFLKPGGFFYLADTHPTALCFDVYDDDAGLQLHYDYFTDGRPLKFEDESGSYADPTAKTEANLSYEWQHSLDEIINSLLAAGLRLKYIHEFPYAFFNLYYKTKPELMFKDEAGWWRLREKANSLPLMFSLCVEKP
ncbi:MAG TPA: class I SAM-dependent methyltransferase [bacterium]|nr:class I SAM-dependent methyltransferase [bacterium]